MKTEKIIIEIPAGLTPAEKKETLKMAIDLIDKSLPRRRIAKAIESLKHSVWPKDIEVTFTDQRSS